MELEHSAMWTIMHARFYRGCGLSNKADKIFKIGR